MSALVFSTLSAINVAYAQQQSQAFAANLQGSNEVPPVDTPATGTAQLQVSSDGKDMSYDLSATNLNGLYDGSHLPRKIRRERSTYNNSTQMGKGKITSSDLQGPLAGKQLSDLVDIIKNGQAYVNVHTDQNQNGEIRGQIMSTGSS